MPETIKTGGTDFEAFYERNYKLVYRLCFTYMKNAADAEDCTEDVFVKAISGGFSFHDETHEKKWLTVVSINLCKDKLKHWWRKRVSNLDDAPEIADEKSGKPLDETLECVMKLPTKYKDVIYLHYYLDYKTDEIALMLKKPPSTVRNHLREARALLEKQLGGLE